MEKITQEEEKKLISLVDFAKDIDKFTTSHEEIHRIKEKLILKLNMLIIPLADDRRNIMEIESEINQNINNEELNDLYQNDPVTISMLQYMRITKSYDLKKEQAIEVFYQCIIQLLEKINEGILKPIKRTEFISEDEKLFTDEEISAIKNKAERWVLYWKKANTSTKKQIEYQVWKEALGNKQKFSIFNDMFYEHTGEYILDRVKREKEKKENADSPNIE